MAFFVDYCIVVIAIRNYLLGANNNNQDDESMTDAEEYGYEIPVAENLMSELGDMNNMDKRFFGRWRNLNYT
jgi:hypothetical protein